MPALVSFLGFMTLASSQPPSSSPGVLIGRHDGTVPCADCGGTPAAVVVSDADSGRRLELQLEQLLVIRLTGSRSTGFSWTRRAGEGSALEPQGEPDYVPNPGMGVVGAAGVEIFRFKAARSGPQTLVFDYARHGQRDQPPTRTVSFEASVR